ncbi:PD-(D/E)XK nuclease-like domain-containing protein [Bradyrhizobium yuanmingense]|uniref:PD-(D/E)XK nuclease-like domain-containing protein n=1 Tax=Bradyrhizobium yuanmingense TaxID=108015 RepID=UPI00068723CD|nr:PD-(D/E)XK nuclease-like domain-containing protein [Bradyrhizobium yuanmingense]
MEPGVYRGLANDVYHRGPGISKSGLDLIRKSPAHYRAVVTAANDNERAPTAAQFIGTALHMIVLEPQLFAQTYTLALQRSDVPDAIEDREVLVAMVGKLNEGRLPKLPTSGSKAELVERILEFVGNCSREELEAKKGADLKAIIEEANTKRAGLLPTSGSRHDLAELLRANGVAVTLWSDVQAEWMQANGHRTILTREQFEQLRNMRDAIMAHPAASKLLSAPGESELSAYWMQPVPDPKTGDILGEQLCRVRPDFWRKDGIIIDLKTTDDASEEEFARSIAKWRYHVQDSFYRHGIDAALRQGGAFEDFAAPRAFVFIAVEKTACVVDGQAKGVAVYSLDEESRALGWQQWNEDLARYTKCQNSGEWPGYAINIRQIKLPAWQFQRAAQQAAASE